MNSERGGGPHVPTATSHLAVPGDDDATDQLAPGGRRKRQLAMIDRGGTKATRSLHDPTGYRVFAALVVAAMLAIALHAALTGQLAGAGRLFVWWLVFAAASNVLPVPSVRNVYLSMSSPVNIAVAVLAPPGVAGTLVAAASVSEWEVKGETTFSHAAFNRAQLGLSTALASVVFGLGDRHAPPIPIIIGGVVAYQATNWLLVAMAEWTCRHERPHRVLRGLLPGGSAAVTYAVLGFAGVALALAFERVGGWAVALLMLPLLGARHALAVSRRLEEAERTGRELADRLIHERERERARIASDIHDVVLQDLAALQLQADNLATAVSEGKDQLVHGMSEQIRDSTEQAIADLRGSIARLRRPSVDDDGLSATLTRFARVFSRQSGVQTSVHATRSADRLPMSVAVLLYECAQEALTNIARHAQATTAVVRLRADGGGAELKVIDDGVGVTDHVDGPGSDGADGDRVEDDVVGGSGLALMREKLAMSGGGVWVTAGNGRGTELTVRVPVPSRPGRSDRS